MCGILGEINFDGQKTSPDNFLKILSLSSRRGPDYVGIFNEIENIQFGFNRLSILDLSANAHQPIFSNDQKYLMVFNGEIYNYIDIKNKLEQLGVEIKSSGDTEVLVNSFSKLGIDQTVKMLDGMFAIALFNIEKKMLYLIRDFGGVKPLYFGHNKKGIVFASQFNQIAKHQYFRDNQINYSILKLFLHQQYVPAPYGLLDQTYQVKPGEIVSFDLNGSIKKERYWELPRYNSPSVFRKEQAIHIIKTNINDNIKKQLVSDVPIGAFLSGGVDSSLICNYAQKNKNLPLMTFSIGSESNSHDESLEASRFSKMIGTNHKMRVMDSKITLNTLTEQNFAISEPFADISILPTFLASKLARKNVKVVLSGDGADELFFGYERFWSVAKNIHFQDYNKKIKYILYGLDKFFFDNYHINSLLLYENQCSAHFDLHSQFSAKEIECLIPQLSEYQFPQNYDVYNYPNEKKEMKLISSMRYSEYYGMLQKTLRKVDLASMANSLEVRVPFLNKKLIEASYTLDPYLNYGPNFGKNSGKKHLLKTILKDQLPSIDISNIKKGFSIPFRNILNDSLFDEFYETLSDRTLCEHFNIDINYVEKILNEHRSYYIDHKVKLFTIYSLFKFQASLLN